VILGGIYTSQDGAYKALIINGISIKALIISV